MSRRSDAHPALAATHRMPYHLMQLHHMDPDMRTTLDLDDDVLASAKEIARRQNTTAGRVLSDLARSALTQAAAPNPRAARAPAPVHGFRAFASRGAVVTNALVDKLRDEGEY
jgi:hypothetical protein